MLENPALHVELRKDDMSDTEQTNPSSTVFASAGGKVDREERVDNPLKAGLTVDMSSNLPVKKVVRTLTYKGSKQFLTRG